MPTARSFCGPVPTGRPEMSLELLLHLCKSLMIDSLATHSDKPIIRDALCVVYNCRTSQFGLVSFTLLLCGPLRDDDDHDFSTAQGRRYGGPRRLWDTQHQPPWFSLLFLQVKFYVLPFPLLSGLARSDNIVSPLLFSLPSGMRKSPDVSPRRLSDISPQLRQLKYLVVDEAIKEDLKSSRSVEDINSASIEERILRITGYYGYQPWSTSYKSKSPNLDLFVDLIS